MTKEELQQAAGIPHLPTNLTYDCRMAIGGEGPRAIDWVDKPHRLVYDLSREVEKCSHLVREFFALLDKVEETDEGRSFRPNTFSSCREFDRIKMGKIMSELKDLTK